MAQLEALPHAVVVPEAGLVWCPNAKAGTSTMIDILERKLGATRAINTWSPRNLLSPSAKKRSLDAGRMSLEAKQAFCERGDALSFSILRNPWERTVSAYLGKVASGKISPDGDHNRRLSFSQFVQWLSLNNDTETDIHFMSWSYRCGPVSHGYSLLGAVETLDDDLSTLLDALHWDQELKQGEQLSSLEDCKMQLECHRSIVDQLGADAFAGMQSSSDLAWKLYQQGSSPEHDLIELVRHRYKRDVAVGGYHPPDQPAWRLDACFSFLV